MLSHACPKVHVSMLPLRILLLLLVLRMRLTRVQNAMSMLGRLHLLVRLLRVMLLLLHLLLLLLHLLLLLLLLLLPWLLLWLLLWLLYPHVRWGLLLQCWTRPCCGCGWPERLVFVPVKGNVAVFPCP